MSPSCRVAIADQQPQVLSFLRHTVEGLGHDVAAEATSGAALVEQCRDTSPDLIIASLELPGENGIEVVRVIQELKPIPLIAMSATCTTATIDRAAECGAYAYLVMPIEASSLQAAITLTMRRYSELQASRHDADLARQAVQDRKAIERAKGLIMQRLGIDEPTAFRHLQTQARRTRKTLAALADSLLVSEQALSM
ncbi:ANTAR domain-containing response regulator [Botrimarina mediterranea]|uniref:ANTAR domain-containing response regulator n=1 Tax=Botrimarina mediterranea TaxID=2528022 RepID=UPI00118CEAEC|nr:putative transcriptional regulatory protein pdtaR [Planctomycetes bacterium K2D]